MEIGDSYYHKDSPEITVRVLLFTDQSIKLLKLIPVPHGKKRAVNEIGISMTEFKANYFKSDTHNIIDMIRDSKTRQQVEAPMIDARYNKFKDGVK